MTLGHFGYFNEYHCVGRMCKVLSKTISISAQICNSDHELSFRAQINFDFYNLSFLVFLGIF